MTAYFSPMQSIAPPSMVVSLPGTEAPFPVTSVDYTGRVTGGGSPTQTVTATTSAVSTPAAVQSGIVDNCVKFYKTVANDGCYDIAIAHDITPDQFLVSSRKVWRNNESIDADYTVQGMESRCQG